MDGYGSSHLYIGKLRVPINVLATKNWEGLKTVETFEIMSRWPRRADHTFPTLLTCHILCGGPCGIISSSSPNNNKPFISLHQECVKNNQAAYVANITLSPAIHQLAGDAAYQGPFLLCPLSISSGSTGAEAFAIFPTGTQAADITLNIIKTKQLPLILDLDETLIVGKTARHLAVAIQKAKDDYLKNKEDKSKKLQIQLLEEDRSMLQSFSVSKKVKLPDGSEVEATREALVDETDKEIERLVLRLPGDDLKMFVSIHEHRRETDMIFRIRPRWEELRAYLTGPNSPYLCYVCTTGLQDYAHEAWRNLDPDPDRPLIPVKERRIRMVARLGAELEKPKRIETIFQGVKPAPKGMSCVPLAIIIDDRVDVWGAALFSRSNSIKKATEAADYMQVMQVLPYAPWEEEANSRLGIVQHPTLEQVSAEMVRVKENLVDVHKSIFSYIENLKAKYSSTLGGGMSIDLDNWQHHYSALFGQPLTVERALERWRHQEGKPPNVPFYWGPWAPIDTKKQQLAQENARTMFLKAQPQRPESWQQIQQQQYQRSPHHGHLLPQDKADLAKHGFYRRNTSKPASPEHPVVGVGKQEQGNGKIFSQVAVQRVPEREHKTFSSTFFVPPPPPFADAPSLPLPEEKTTFIAPTAEEERIAAEIHRDFVRVLKGILQRERKLINSRAKSDASAAAQPKQEATVPPPMFSKATKHRPADPRKKLGQGAVPAAGAAVPSEETTPYLWIMNLKSDITETMLGERLSRFNNIKYVSKRVGKSFGCVDFRSLKDAQTAKSELNGKSFVDLSGNEKLLVTLGHSAPISIHSKQNASKSEYQGSLEPGASYHHTSAPVSKRPRFS